MLIARASCCHKFYNNHCSAKVCCALYSCRRFLMEGLEEEVVPLCAPHNFGEVGFFC
jgi:hypothetical protein